MAGGITDDAGFERLLQSLYAGATDPARMTGFLGDLVAATNSHTGALQVHDPRHSQGQLVLTVGAIAMGSDELRRYNETYAGENVWMERGAALLAANGMASGTEIIKPTELRKTRFHRDYLQALDIHDSFGVVLWAGAEGEVAALTVNRAQRQGEFDEEERRLLLRLQPHLQNAYALQRRLSWADQERRSLLSALDQVSYGMLLFDTSRRVRVANAMAGSLLGGRVDVGQWLSSVPGFDAADIAALRGAIDRAVRSPLPAPCRLLLRNAGGAPELVAIVQAMPVAGFADAGASSARASVFLHPLRARVEGSDGELLLVELYGLSPAQARLACLLCAGMDLAECAERLGNRMHTVKSQLKVIYRKTGTHRQAELVAMLGALLRS